MSDVYGEGVLYSEVVVMVAKGFPLPCEQTDKH